MSATPSLPVERMAAIYGAAVELAAAEWRLQERADDESRLRAAHDAAQRLRGAVLVAAEVGVSDDSIQLASHLSAARLDDLIHNRYPIRPER